MMPTSESKKHKTPNGGDRSEIYYQDADGNLVDKSKAVKGELIEYKGKKQIHRSYVDIK